MNEYIKQVELAATDITLNKPADIDCLMSPRDTYASKIMELFCAKTDTQSAWAWLLQQHKLAQNGAVDLATLRRISATYLRFIGGKVKNSYGMCHTAALAENSVAALDKIDSFDELAALLWALQRYFGQLAYWCDLTVPWCGLSKSYEELTAER